MRKILRNLISNGSEGIFTYASTNLTKNTLNKPTEIIGEHFLKFIHPDDIES
jgi:hypothetical protein